MPKKLIRKAASILNAAMKDADLARKTVHDPAFQREVQADRRGALSRYKTVQHALRDRAAPERATQKLKPAEPAKPQAGRTTRAAGKPATGRTTRAAGKPARGSTERKAGR